jgi:hypothetical protein
MYHAYDAVRLDLNTLRDSFECPVKPSLAASNLDQAKNVLIQVMKALPFPLEWSKGSSTIP